MARSPPSTSKSKLLRPPVTTTGGPTAPGGGRPGIISHAEKPTPRQPGTPSAAHHVCHTAPLGSVANTSSRPSLKLTAAGADASQPPLDSHPSQRLPCQV